MNNQRIRVGNLTTIYRRGKKRTYTADFWTNGRHCRRSLKTTNLKVARTRAIKLETELLAGNLAAPVKRVAIGNAISAYVAFLTTEGRRPKTVQKYSSFLATFCEFCLRANVECLAEINPSLIDRFRAVRKPTHSVKSMHNEAVMLKGFVAWCVGRHLLEANPMAAMRFSRPVLPPRGGPSLDEIKQVLAIAKEPRGTQIAVLAFTGCRTGELQRLMVEDVNLANGWIHINSRAGGETKTGQSRKVPIHSQLRILLGRFCKPKGPWYFTAPPSKKYPDGHHQISTKHLNEDLLKLLRAAGISAGRNAGYTVHSLRHSFETICTNAGVPQRAVDTWLGHRSDRSMASVYYRLSDEDSRRFMEMVPFGTGEPAAVAGE